MLAGDRAILEGDIRKSYIKYLVPSVGGMLGNALYILGDTIVVGRAMGGPGLAAVNISIPMIKLVNSIGLIVGVGGATALSVSRGRGDYERGNQIFSLSMIIGIVLGLLVTAWNYMDMDRIVYALGGTDYSFSMTKTYLEVVMLTSVFKILSMALGLFIRNDGSPNLVMVASLASSFFNIVFDYIFIYPMKMGIFGGGLATALSPIVSLAIMSLHFIRGRNQLSFHWSWDGFLIKRILQNGFPSALIELSAGVVVYIFNLVLLRTVGDIGVSAYSIIANLSLVGNSIFNGMGQAIQPLVSMNYGAGKMDRVYESMRLGSLTALVTGLIFYLLGLFFPDFLASLFTVEKGELLSITSWGIKLYFSSFIFMGLNIVLTSYIQSMEDYKISTFISLLRGSLLVVLVLFIMVRLYGLAGIWLTMSIVEVLTCLICLGAFKIFRQALAYIVLGRIDI